MSKSLLSKIVELILWKTKPAYMNSQEEVEKFLKNKTDEDFKTMFHSEECYGLKYVLIGEKYEDNHAILYFHGGAYVNQLNIQHQLYCYILSKLLKKPVFIPVYPLAPKHTFIESYELLTKLYSNLEEKYEYITLMGDSAGGGLALAFSQYLNKNNLRQADNIIVFSPWLDVSMNNNIDDSNDPILGNTGLKEIGKTWAGNYDLTDYRISPFYGPNTNMPRILLFSGSNEIFYENIENYYYTLIKNNVDAKLIVGRDLFHIYPLFPIPEAINALKKVKNEIKN